MNWLSTNYNKLIIMILTVVVIVGNQMAGQDLGLSLIAMKWISIAVGTAGAILTGLVANKNQPTIGPGQVTVNRTDIPSSTPIVASHKP